MIGPAGPPGKPGDVGPKGKCETSAISKVEWSLHSLFVDRKSFPFDQARY